MSSGSLMSLCGGFLFIEVLCLFVFVFFVEVLRPFFMVLYLFVELFYFWSFCVLFVKDLCVSSGFVFVCVFFNMCTSNQPPQD